MVSTRPIMVALPATETIPLIRIDAKPVTVMQPAMIPAMAQAQATVMAPRAPASSASRIFFRVMRFFGFSAPTTMVATMDRAAAVWMVRVLEDTSHTSSTSGISR